MYTPYSSFPELFDDLHKEAIFTPPGIYHSQECHHFLLLWLKIFTPTIQTDVDEGQNAQDWKGTSNSRPHEKKDKSHASVN